MPRGQVHYHEDLDCPDDCGSPFGLRLGGGYPEEHPTSAPPAEPTGICARFRSWWWQMTAPLPDDLVRRP